MLSTIKPHESWSYTQATCKSEGTNKDLINEPSLKHKPGFILRTSTISYGHADCYTDRYFRIRKKLYRAIVLEVCFYFNISKKKKSGDDVQGMYNCSGIQTGDALQQY